MRPSSHSSYHIISYHIISFFILLTSIFLNINLAYAGSLTAVLGDDGVAKLKADFTGDFNCVPEGVSPSTTIVEILGCEVLKTSGWSASGEQKYPCPQKGRNHWYAAHSVGGKYFINQYGELVCITEGVSAQAFATETTDKEVEILSPTGRVNKGIVDVVVRYDFKYNAAYCSIGGIPSRIVSVDSVGTQSNLSVSGTASFPYNFSNANGVVKITARACCGGSCIITNKLVYIEPEEDDKCLDVGKPVNVASGRVYTSETDFFLSGVMPISFIRYYNSKSTILGGFSTRWSHIFDARIIEFGGGTYYKVINPNGSIAYYTDNDGDRIYEPELPKGITSRLIRNSNNTFVREFKDGTREEFNAFGYLTSVVDRNGNRIRLTRDTGNRLIKITDPSGREATLTYDTANRINQITLPDGKILSYTYLSGMLQKATYPDGSQRVYEYSYSNTNSINANLAGIKNENGSYIEKHTYDSKDRGITSSADGVNEKLTINYISDTQSTVTDSLGRVTTYTIDKSGGKSRVTSISGPGCSECGQGNTSYTYDDNLNITSMTDGNGNVTAFTYDSKGNMLTKTESYGTALQRTTNYTYEPIFNQVTSITDPMGNTTYLGYDSKGNLISITDANGAATDLTRNTQGLITQITDAQGNNTAIAYDQYGNPAAITDSLGNTTAYTYDITGNLLSVLDANGNQTAYNYDQRGRLKEVRDSLNQLTTYTYDPAGNLTALTDAKGNKTQFTYDSINRLIKEINAIGKERTYAYDTEGNLKTRTDANGKATTYSYNDYNRLTTISHPNNTQSTFSYDSIGNMLSAANPNISYSFTYDALNRNTIATDNANRAISYAYDKNSNRLFRTDPAGGITQYTYNLLNMVATISSPFGQTSRYTYDNLRRRTKLSLPNNIAISYNYDSLSRLINIINGNIANNSYTNDRVGNRTSMTDATGTHNYAYDQIYRLTQAAHPAIPAEQFSYDPVGNRQNSTVDAANRLLEDTNYTYTYDNNGNLIQKISKTTGAVTAYAYDNENRLVQLTTPNAQLITYKYDPFGRRIEKNVNGAITRYVYDREDILFELDRDNNIVTEYLHGPGIDEPIAMIKNNQTYYYHADGLGSIIAITDSSGNVVQRYEYNSFGEITYQQDSNFIQPYTYTGREYDQESGLYYYRARYYDAKIGRFLQQDPILSPMSPLSIGLNPRLYKHIWLLPYLRSNPTILHPYNYVGNSPTNYIDPNGLGPIAAGICAALDLYSAYSTMKDLERLGKELNALKPQIRELEDKCYNTMTGTDADFERLRELQLEAIQKTSEFTKAQLWGYAPNIAIGFGCAALALIPAIP